MEAIILVTAAVSMVTTVWFFLKVTTHVCVTDPLFGAKAFTWGLGSAALGYLSQGRVEIKIVLWGIGGVVAFALYQLLTEKG